MKGLSGMIGVFTIALLATLASCTHQQSLAEMEFDVGIRTLADDLAGQLEKNGVGKGLNKVEVNPLTRRGTMKRIVIEPFIDTESGHPVKLNALISSIMTVEMAKRFAMTGIVDQKNLEILEYVVTGLVSLEETSSGPRIYKINAAVYEKSSGVVHASAEARIKGLDARRRGSQ